MKLNFEEISKWFAGAAGITVVITSLYGISNFYYWQGTVDNNVNTLKTTVSSIQKDISDIKLLLIRNSSDRHELDE